MLSVLFQTGTEINLSKEIFIVRCLLVSLLGASVYGATVGGRFINWSLNDGASEQQRADGFVQVGLLRYCMLKEDDEVFWQRCPSYTAHFLYSLKASSVRKIVNTAGMRVCIYVNPFLPDLF